MLGTDVDLDPFYALAERGPPELARLVAAFRGVKPPRTAFPDLDPSRLLGHLGPYRGMLYYHLLLARGAGG
ncbi:MAG TPA: hypothetical protein VKY51_01715 [Fredinandcohnia sp.]|nr:hypothetical protein [Fredinandcohnia sp.]